MNANLTQRRGYSMTVFPEGSGQVIWQNNSLYVSEYKIITQIKTLFFKYS